MVGKYWEWRIKINDWVIGDIILYYGIRYLGKNLILGGFYEYVYVIYKVCRLG